MSCIGDAFCPECREIIYGNACMCGLTCDRGEPRHSCTMDAPDGIWPRRMYGQPKPSQLVETRNGWWVGWTLSMDGEWQRSELGHATKSSGTLRMEDILGSARLSYPLQFTAIRVERAGAEMGEGGGI